MGKLYRAEVNVVAYIVVEDGEEEPDEYDMMDALREEMGNKDLPDFSEEITDPEHKPEWEPECLCYNVIGGSSDITVEDAMAEVRKNYGQKTDSD